MIKFLILSVMAIHLYSPTVCDPMCQDHDGGKNSLTITAYKDVQKKF